MELIPNIRFHTAVVAVIFILMTITILAFRPSDDVAKATLIVLTVVGFGISMRHSIRQQRKLEDQENSRSH